MGANKFAIEKKCEIPEGAYGVFQVPEHNIIIPLYKGNNATGQAIVDREYAADIEYFNGRWIIYDHAESVSINNKGIWDVSEFKPDTVAFLTTPKETICYSSKCVCRAVRQNTCFQYDGKVIYPKSATDLMTASCCDSTGKEVYLAIFKECSRIPAKKK